MNGFSAAAALLLALTAPPASAAGSGASGAPPSPRLLPLTQHVHDRWTQREGLPHNVVEVALVSRDGYLWLGTQEGLVRFDGARFQLFDRASAPGLAGDQIYALVEDAAGDLWVGTSSGLSRLRQGSFETLPSGGPAAEAIHRLVRDGDELWATAATGLRRRVGGAWLAVERVPGFEGDRAPALAAARGGGVWTGGERGLARRRGEKVEPISAAGLPSGSIVALLEEADGTLWAGTARGLARRAPGAATFAEVTGLGPVEIRALEAVPGGGAWAATSSGIFRLAGGRPEPVPDLRGAANGLWAQPDGTLWFGTETDGLHRLRTGTVRTIAREEGLSSLAAWAVAASADGSVLVSGDAGLDRVAGDRATAVRPEQVGSEGLTGLLEDREGDLWVGTDARGLLRLGRRGARRYGPAEGLATQPRVIFQDPAGAIWVGARDALYRLAGERFERVAPVPGPVSAALRAPDGTLWVGTTAGLLRLADGRLAPVAFAPASEASDVTSLLLEPDGALWIGTVGNGLWLLRGAEARRLTRHEGLHENVIYAIADDGRGGLWLSGSHGLSRIDRAQALAVAAGRAPAVAATVLGRGDGMREIECSGGVQPSFARTGDGRLWFPTIHGVVVVDPAQVRPNPETPRLIFEEVVVDGARQRPGPAMRLAAGTRRVEIRYTAAALASADRVRFRHRLAGLDPAFLDVGGERAVHYAGLGPGRYLFELQAANESGVWSAAPATLAFEIEPRFWQTGWFTGLLAAALAALMALAVQLRTRQLRAAQAALTTRVEEEAAKVKALTGLVPICAWCKKIKDQKGAWLPMERFIARSARAEITHGMCPDCLEKQLGPEENAP